MRWDGDGIEWGVSPYLHLQCASAHAFVQCSKRPKNPYTGNPQHTKIASQPASHELGRAYLPHMGDFVEPPPKPNSKSLVFCFFSIQVGPSGLALAIGSGWQTGI